MIVGQFNKIKKSIQMSSLDAKALGRELIHQAEEAEDHGWMHIAEICDDNMKKIITFDIRPCYPTINNGDEFEVEEEQEVEEDDELRAV